MGLSDEQKKKITKILEDWLATKINQYSRETSYMPFGDRIIRNKGHIRMYSFTHSILTSLGQSIYEQIGAIAASENSDVSQKSWKTSLTVSKKRKNKVTEIVDGLRNGDRQANKENEIKEILDIPNDDCVNVKDGRIVDLYIKRKSSEYLFEIKTVKPNIDIFTKTKNKLLMWVARENREITTAIAFPYNPYYPESYTRFTIQGVMAVDEVFVGKDFWNFLGGDGCYEEILEIFDYVGKDFWKKIQEKIFESEEHGQ